MADLAAIERALRAADAAGNTEDARRLAQAYAKASAKPDFANVQGGAQSKQRGPLIDGKPVSELSATRRFGLGIGSAIADPLVGLSQMTGIGSEQWQNETKARIDAVRDTTAGKVGAVAGDVALYTVPAIKAAQLGRAIKGTGKLAATGRAVAPWAGSAALGGGAGALRSTDDGASRGGQAAAGATAGVIGYGAGSALGAGVRGIRGLVDPVTRKGQERIAALTLRNAAVDPNRLGAVAPSAIPGVQRTLAEETMDPGIAQLQRQFPQELNDQVLQNNLARADAIRSTFEGASKSSAAAIRAERDAAASQALEMLPNAGFVRRIPVKESIQAAIKNHTGNPAVQKDLREVLSELPEVKTAAQAYNLRKYIDHLLSNNSTKPAIRTAKRELMAVKGEIDDAITAAFPGWRTYLDDYAGASKRATQADVGSAILGKSRAAIDPQTGQRVMTPNALAGSVNNIDQIVRGVTKFGPATAANTLTKKQQGLLGLLADDAGRMDAVASYGRASGSDTAQNLGTQALMANMFGGGQLSRLIGGSQPAQRLLLSPIQKTLNLLGVPERLRAVTSELLANPQAARTALANLNASDRAIVQRALAAAGAGAGASLAPAAAAGQ